MKTGLLVLLLSCAAAYGQVSFQTGEQFLEALHSRYYRGPCPIYSFSQKNSHYRNDSLIRHSTWHEVIAFPDRFRIQFGDPAKGNAVFFRNDSAFQYKAGNLLKSRRDSNSLLLILGGMYYREFNDVLNRLKQSGFNCSLLSEQEWKGKAVYVLGAQAGDLKPNQIWFDKSDFRVLRIIENLNEKDKMDMRFESHLPWCKGFVENKVSFYRNGKLEQVEEYYDLKAIDRFPE